MLAGVWEKPVGEVWEGPPGMCWAREVERDYSALWDVCFSTKVRFIHRKGNCSTLPGLMGFSTVVSEGDRRLQSRLWWSRQALYELRITE